MPEFRPAAVVVLAAGEGTRMRSAKPKVLHEIAGRSLVAHVLATAAALEPERTLVVVGSGRAAVLEHLSQLLPSAVPVVQEEQRGTGHAVRTALDECPDLAGTLLVLPGDAPLLQPQTLRALLARHEEHAAAATLLTARVPDPSGYGRVVRDGGAVRAVVEERDADAATKAIDEIATSVYAFDGKLLRRALDDIGTENAAGEEYLTDVVARLVDAGHVVTAWQVDDHREVLGVNDRAQLAAAGRVLRDRLVYELMRGGVTVIDPSSLWIEVGVEVEADATIHPNVQLCSGTRIEAGAVVGPGVTLTDTRVGPDAVVTYSVCHGADIGEAAHVGPFTYLRPGTRLGRRTKAGSYVEMKSAAVGDDSKVPHLSYVGDAEIGERSNIGAATIFANYDGQEKHHTAVGDDVRIGSDTTLVAPVSVGDGAYTGAGSVITKDVPPGALGVARGPQRNIEGWVERRRAGSRSAEAARRAKRRDGVQDGGNPQ